MTPFGPESTILPYQMRSFGHENINPLYRIAIFGPENAILPCQTVTFGHTCHVFPICKAQKHSILHTS